MTWHAVWQLTDAAAARLHERADLERTLEMLARFPLATWTRYMLGGVGVSRPMELGRLQIDAMTQRTQAIALVDEASGHRAMFDLGKQGGPPSALITFAAPPSQERADALARFLESCIQTQPTRRAAALSPRSAQLAPLPRLERVASWDWLGPDLLSDLESLDWDAAPASVRALAQGRQLCAGGDAWWEAEPDALARLHAWWGAQLSA